MRKSWFEAFWEAGRVVLRHPAGKAGYSCEQRDGARGFLILKLTEGVSFCRLAATSFSTTVNEVSFLSKAFRFKVLSASSFSIFSQLSSAPSSLPLLLPSPSPLVFDCASS